MKSCKTCKHFIPRGGGLPYGDCFVWTLDERDEAAKHVPACYSILKQVVMNDAGEFCAFHVPKK
jgi:hypothetical protein